MSEKTDDTKPDWEKRKWDPMWKMKWNSEIRVEPANAEKGDHIGFRIYPDGTREAFTVHGQR